MKHGEGLVICSEHAGKGLSWHLTQRVVESE